MSMTYSLIHVESGISLVSLDLRVTHPEKPDLKDITDPSLMASAESS